MQRNHQTLNETFPPSLENISHKFSGFIAKRSVIITSILLMASLFLFWGCSRNKEGDNYTKVEAEDAAMNAAIEKAKATVAEFVQAFQTQKPGTTDYFVKKPYATPDGGVEHMWIEVLEAENGVLKGRIANEAEETREVKIGQIISLKISEISDWKYHDNNKLVGGFTIRYFLDKMPARERETFLKQAGFEL
jgi:uncharacterized protein YegJ (DUF2314 family)